MVTRPKPPDVHSPAAWYRFVLWMATPPSKREVRTMAELADLIDVSPRTLSGWKAKPGFQDAVYLETRKTLEYRLPAILQALAQKAKSGDVSAIKLALELSGRYTERHTFTHEVRQFGADEFKKESIHVAQYEERLLEESDEGSGPDADE